MSEIDLTAVDPQSAMDAIRLAQALMLRAANVVSDSPFHKYCYEEGSLTEGRFPRLIEINGDTVKFWWNECYCRGDGDRIIDIESCEFPSRLLFVSDLEVDGFHIEAQIEEELQGRLIRELYDAEEAAKNEVIERAWLAKLKAKYPD